VFSPSWYRVEALRPRLRQHAQVHRHHYRGQLWYVLQDHAAARYHRFTPTAYYVIGQMDGKRTVQDIWDAANTRLGDGAPTQDQVIELLGQLHAADVLQCDVTPDSEEFLRRYDRDRRSQWQRRLMSPLALRMPVFDPDRLLESLLPLVRPLFSRFAAVVWLAVVLTAVAHAASSWDGLSAQFSERLLSPTSLLLLWLAFPFLKLLHELGHAFATKVWGGEVHEMGITLLVLTPVPYVDASAASAFPDKHRRMLVGAAGMMVELFLASVALFVWLNVEPGAVRELAFDVMLIAGLSTVLFNANPLLKFDGYYILADGIEIPNLASRSYKYLGYLVQRYVFGIQEASSPVMAAGEGRWFLVYGIGAFVYRLAISFVIALFVASQLFVVGVVLACWMLTTQIVFPLLKGMRFLLLSPLTQPKRVRAVSLTVVAVMGVTGVVAGVPVPFWTRAEGVVWLPEQSQVRAGIDGTIDRLLTTPDAPVQPGEALFETLDPLLDAEVTVLRAKLAESLARYKAALSDDRVQAKILEDELAHATAELEQAEARADKLVVRSPTTGTFIVPQSDDLPGRFVEKGELLGYVADPSRASIRVVVAQADIALVRTQTRRVEVKLASRLDQTLPAVMHREVPAANYLLPSKVLGTAGGGRIPVDPRDERGVRAIDKVFQLDIALAPDQPLDHFGERVLVRFDHGSATLAHQWYRLGRQLFLGRFGV
jgi:putative peptide zinc metalloprotease protein